MRCIEMLYGNQPLKHHCGLIETWDVLKSPPTQLPEFGMED